MNNRIEIQALAVIFDLQNVTFKSGKETAKNCGIQVRAATPENSFDELELLWLLYWSETSINELITAVMMQKLSTLMRVRPASISTINSNTINPVQGNHVTLDFSSSHDQIYTTPAIHGKYDVSSKWIISLGPSHLLMYSRSTNLPYPPI